MKVLAKQVGYSSTIKKSKFLCFGYFVQNKNDVKNIVDSLKKKYSDANHICYAYVLDNNTFYFTDGGEPSGTAGKPIYGALQSFKLNYTLVVVIRYFGGIKFGPGPLRSTFKGLAMQTLELAKLKECVVADVIQVNVPYDLAKKVATILNSFIISKQFKKEYVHIELAGDKKIILNKLKSLNLKPQTIKENQVV